LLLLHRGAGVTADCCGHRLDSSIAEDNTVTEDDTITEDNTVA
jgi:hypothetical protein